MKLVICWLMLLPLVTAAPIRARRQNVLTFLNAHKNPPSEPKKEQDSQDLSEDQSLESASQETLEDLDSDEVPQAKGKAKTPPGRRAGAECASSRRAQDQQSGERADLNSETDITDGGNVSSKMSVQGGSFQRKASAEGADSLAKRERPDQGSLEIRPAAVVGETDNDGPGSRSVGIHPS